MNLSNEESLDEFARRHHDLTETLRNIKRKARAAVWRQPLDVKKTFSGARTAPGGWIVLNIKGGHFRLVAKADYRMGTLRISFIGNHAQYERFSKRVGLTP